MSHKIKAYFLLFLSAVMWGSSYPVIKLGLNRGLSPIGFLGLRLFLATIIIIPFVYKEIGFKELWNKKMALLGLTNAGGFLFQYFGQKFISSNSAAIISNLIVIFVAILSFIFLKEKMNFRKIIGVFLSFLGLIIISNLSFSSFSANIGILIMLISPFMWAFFVILSKDISMGGNFTKHLFPIYFYTFIFVLPFSLAEGGDYSNLSISLSLYLSIFCTIIPYFFFLKGLKYIQATTASIITSFQIFFSIIFSYIFLKETLSLNFIVGMILVFVSIYLVETNSSTSVSN